jgi:uncharacterized membrane protein
MTGGLMAPFAVHVVLAQREGGPLWLAQMMAALQVGTMAWIAAGTVTRPTGQVRWLIAVLAMAIFLTAANTAAQASLIVVAALSHGAIYLGVGLLFGLSLRPGQEALVSRLARRLESCPTGALMAYTRGVTWLWTGFSAAQIAISALLLATAPLPVWSVFVNVLSLPLVALTFAAEYAVRRWRFRHMPMASLATTLAAFSRRNRIDGAPAAFVQKS